MVNCPHCGKDFIPVPGQRYCPFCGEPVEVAPPANRVDTEDSSRDRWPGERDAEPFSSGPAGYCPWEDQENLGFFKGITETLRQSLFSPQEFFARCPRTGGFVVPLLYALIVKTTSSLVSVLWLFSTKNPLLEKLDLSGNGMMLVGLMIPIALFMSIVIEAGIVHLSLFLLGSAKEDFESTFRVVCYGSGPELLDVIPLIGGWIALMWKTFLFIIGLREFHRISTGRAVLAIVLPSLFCFGVIGITFALLLKSVGT